MGKPCGCKHSTQSASATPVQAAAAAPFHYCGGHHQPHNPPFPSNMSSVMKPHLVHAGQRVHDHRVALDQLHQLAVDDVLACGAQGEGGTGNSAG